MIAAQCLAPLPFRQADGKPPGGVQNRERAEDDKEDCFVHVRITSSSGRSSVNAIKRRGGLIHVMNTGRSRDPTSTLGCSRIRVRGDPAQRFAPTPMHAGLGAVSVFSKTRGWPVFGRRWRDGDTLSRQLSTSRETARTTGASEAQTCGEKRPPGPVGASYWGVKPFSARLRPISGRVLPDGFCNSRSCCADLS